MIVADAWAAETTTITSAKRAERDRVARETAEFLARGGEIRRFGPTGAAELNHDWRDFTLGGKEELERKRRKGSKKAQRVIELGRR